MKDTGSVERILVGGILVVVLAILGIASWSATGSDDGSPGTAADGGVDAGGAHPVARAGDTAPASVRALDERQREQAAKRREIAGRYVGKDLTPATDADVDAPPADPAASAQGPNAQGPGVQIPGVVGSADPSRPADAGVPVPLSRNGRSKDAVEDLAALDAATPQAEAAAGAPTTVAPAAGLAGASKPAAAPRARSYVVAEGDNLWKIARQGYGEGNVQQMVDAIVAANPTLDPDNIFPGQTLVLPDLSGEPGVITPTPEQIARTTDGRFYEVEDGDTLSTIAAAELGSRGRWEEIYELNRKRIPNPDVLHPGMTLILPKN